MFILFWLVVVIVGMVIVVSFVVIVDYFLLEFVGCVNGVLNVLYFGWVFLV